MLSFEARKGVSENEIFELISKQQKGTCLEKIWVKSFWEESIQFRGPKAGRKGPQGPLEEFFSQNDHKRASTNRNSFVNMQHESSGRGFCLLVAICRAGSLSQQPTPISTHSLLQWSVQNELRCLFIPPQASATISPP